MNRTRKARVLTAADIMTAYDRACEQIKWSRNMAEEVCDSRNDKSADILDKALKEGVELMTIELFDLLTEARE